MDTQSGEQGTPALVKQLADEIIKRLDKSYDLVYVDYRDQLTDTQVDKLVRGDDEWLDESWQFESDSTFESASQIINDVARDVISEWSEETDADLDFLLDALKSDDEWDRVRFEIEDRATGDWVEQLIRHTPRVILRIEALDEDHAYSFEEVEPARVLEDLGLRTTHQNIEAVSYALANASPEYSVLLGYWIVGVDLSDIYKLPYDPEAEVEIVNPHLYLGNPFVGSGFISEPLDGTIRVKRGDLRTDKDAFGYAVEDIYGGLNASSFEAEIRPVAPAAEAQN